MAPKKYADQTRSGRHQASVSFVHPRVERFNFRELARFTPARSSLGKREPRVRVGDQAAGLGVGPVSEEERVDVGGSIFSSRAS